MTFTDMDMTDPPATARPDLDPADAHRAAALRDPRRHPIGYLAGDPGTGALAPTVWFATVEDLIAFLLDTEIALLRFDECDTTRIAGALRHEIGATRDPRRLDPGRLSAAFEGWCQILWVGTFADLCTRGGDVPKHLRLAFRSDTRLGEHAGPIADDEMDDFVEWLQNA
ncbi:hypothetical protein K2Z84_02085 [Candidatus Binatia bacterium]|jgi:hypothetical protein|nr:hypothetical protein [Candidatus Binatia bacterium]